MVEAAPTIGSLIATASERLARAGVTSPTREARWIWNAVDGEEHAEAQSDGRRESHAGQASRFSAAVDRRARGEPLAYVTGTGGFRHLILGADRRALIPRPETEGLVELALARVCTGVAADIGTGSGAIALALRSEGEFMEVIGIDLSADALDLARANGLALGLDVTWRCGDLLAPLRGREVDLLVSNPPYLSRDDMTALDASVRDHEPALALFGGNTGVELTARLLREATAIVKPGGWLVIEIDTRRGDATRDAAISAGWRDVRLHDDVFGRVRYLSARQGGER